MTREEFIRRWTHFKPEEFACKCGHCGPESGLKMKPATMDKLQNTRSDMGIPFVITSGYRCRRHPVEARKSAPGAHNYGQAVDVSLSGEAALNLIGTAQLYGFTGIGVAQKGAGRFIHLDDMASGQNRPRPWIWSY
ncbi:D-Ala-D-Ala carboxypeptidase family metallohydrolase [Photobacterium halotolerans]|nr:D-Ala-D-Ala carboxypeptidase family metallohydrolase [Photobacterium halotolerans]